MSHSLFGFWRVKLLEASLKEAAAMPAPTLAEIRHARTALETVYRAFGVDLPVPHDIESGGVDNTVPTGVAHDLRAEAARDHAFRSLLEESLFLCPETTEDLASTAASPLETPEVVRDFSANEER